MINAPQDLWAAPMAERLIARFRTKGLVFIRVQAGPYNPLTGAATLTETRTPSAGAVAEGSMMGRRGTQESDEIEAWISHKTIDWPISTKDRLAYLGKEWAISRIESYGSGGNGVLPSRLVHLVDATGENIVSADGTPIVGVLGGDPRTAGYTMYASRVFARAQ